MPTAQVCNGQAAPKPARKKVGRCGLTSLVKRNEYGISLLLLRLLCKTVCTNEAAFNLTQAAMLTGPVIFKAPSLKKFTTVLLLVKSRAIYVMSTCRKDPKRKAGVAAVKVSFTVSEPNRVILTM